MCQKRIIGERPTIVVQCSCVGSQFSVLNSQSQPYASDAPLLNLPSASRADPDIVRRRAASRCWIPVADRRFVWIIPDGAASNPDPAADPRSAAWNGRSSADACAACNKLA